jgi:hypothetical protein
MTEEITRIEQQIFELTRELNQLRSQSDGEGPGRPVLPDVESAGHGGYRRIELGPAIQVLGPPCGNG